MTTPTCAITLTPSEHSIIVHYPTASTTESVTAAYLLCLEENYIIYTANDDVDSELLKDGFAFACSLQAYAVLAGGISQEDGVKSVLTLMNELGLEVFSYDYAPENNKVLMNNLLAITVLYSERFFYFSSLLSGEQANALKQCSCKSSLPLLNGKWHVENCPMYSKRDIATKYEDNPPCVSLMLNGQYELESLSVALRDGQFVIHHINSNNEPVYGNVVSDLITLAKSRFVDYLITLNYNITQGELPSRWEK